MFIGIIRLREQKYHATTIQCILLTFIHSNHRSIALAQCGDKKTLSSILPNNKTQLRKSLCKLIFKRNLEKLMQFEEIDSIFWIMPF